MWIVVSSAPARPTAVMSTSAASRVRLPRSIVPPEFLLRDLCAWRLPDQIAPFRVAVEMHLVAQTLERPHDLAPVPAADGGHQLFEEFRPVPQRGLDRREAAALEARRLRNTGFQPVAGAKRPGEVVARLGADPPARERGIERQRAHAGHDDKVAIGLEPGRERPVDL